MPLILRILIVDDSALFRQALRHLLEANPEWEVCGEALDGLDAIEKNRDLTPQLIIMDLSMPRMVGIQSAVHILKEFPLVPIILLTLYVSHQLAEEARNVGIRATVSKTAMHDLPTAIDAILRGGAFEAGVGS